MSFYSTIKSNNQNQKKPNIQISKYSNQNKNQRRYAVNVQQNVVYWSFTSHIEGNNHPRHADSLDFLAQESVIQTEIAVLAPVDEDVPSCSQILQVTVIDADVGLYKDIYYVHKNRSSRRNMQEKPILKIRVETNMRFLNAFTWFRAPVCCVQKTWPHNSGVIVISTGAVWISMVFLKLAGNYPSSAMAEGKTLPTTGVPRRTTEQMDRRYWMDNEEQHAK